MLAISTIKDHSSDVDQLRSDLFDFDGEMHLEVGSRRRFVTEVDLIQTQVDPSFEQLVAQEW
jgi:hypothetical protein